MQRLPLTLDIGISEGVLVCNINASAQVMTDIFTFLICGMQAMIEDSDDEEVRDELVTRMRDFMRIHYYILLRRRAHGDMSEEERSFYD